MTDGGRRPQRVASRRVGASVAVGVVVAGACLAVAPWQLAMIAGWVATATVFVVWLWSTIGRFSPAQTKAHARREDDSRAATDVLLLVASVASLGGMLALLVKANQATGAGRVLLTLFAPVAVVASWTVVHSVFTLRYASEYYTPPDGGIDFKADDESPDYLDFAYVAITIGMTFQVSDTDVQSRAIRRLVMRHALLSYLFGAVIVALTINILATTIK